MPATPFRKPRQSLEAFDKLFERAFAPRDTPPLSLAPLALTDDRDVRPPSPKTQFYSPMETEFPISDGHDHSLDSLWDEVRQAKEVELESSPSKVKSLEGATLSLGSSQSGTAPVRRQTTGEQPQSPGRKRVTKRRSSVNFRESADGRNIMVTFDMTGVKKQDMHVSYRSSRLIVNWKVERTTEKQEEDGVVREREVRRYSHTIPLPEGTKFEEVRASRDSQRLTLTLPSWKCVRMDGDGPEDQLPESLRLIPDIDVCVLRCADFASRLTQS
ncbi:hypothetical protein GSI_02389 [Ganoderma sinense ZZ0214-1]|uniref:SHSP domain-containing protein n=1 Tax=Ganoderma sinense ZZ0214-1 TaxID=1077348 RepID=A0A2G8SPG4_9APHY|nr:hypothetical protein GSI_02389 [Ganoderma sinense ZZ0214-1]